MTLSSKLNPASPNWFGISMVLIGFIIGYSAATVSGSPLAGNNAGNVANPEAPAPAPTPTAPPPAPTAQQVRGPDDTDYIRGEEDAEITLIEYSDFECPFCTRHHPTMQTLLDQYEGKVNWVYRHFPLSFHPNAQKAAEGAECAGELGGADAYWSFTDMVFEKGSDNTQLASYATTIGLDAAAFTTCLDSDKYAQKVKDDMAEGQAAGVRGTPGTVVYNNKTEEARVVSGAQAAANFTSIIDQLLQ